MKQEYGDVFDHRSVQIRRTVTTLKTYQINSLTFHHKLLNKIRINLQVKPQKRLKTENSRKEILIPKYEMMRELIMNEMEWW